MRTPATGLSWRQTAMNFTLGQPRRWPRGRARMAVKPRLSPVETWWGGTWMGVTRGGRFSALTNYRDIAVSGQDPPSRGGLVSGFLNAESQAETYVQSLREHGGKYNGFSLLVYDGIDGYCYSNRADAVTKLTPGVHGLSNHLLNSPWPKVTRGVDAIGQHLVEDDGPTHLAETLFELLRDVYGLLLVCKHHVRSLKGTTANVYPVS